MNLQQMFDLANRRSYFSRPDVEIYAALNAASKKVYLWTAREFRGTFRKTDTATVKFAAGVQTYAVPPDCRIILKFGEQLLNSAAGAPYQWMTPADINSAAFIGREYEALTATIDSGPRSEFVYAGPYLAEADAIASLAGPPGTPGDQVRAVDVSPIPQDSRQTKIVYIAEFVEIGGPGSFVMMPSEAHDAIVDFATEELVRANGDAVQASGYNDAGTKKFQEDFLPFWRMNQQAEMPLTQEPYLSDLS